MSRLNSDNRGLCNLCMDDTNPAKEDVEYVDSIIEDIKWLGLTMEIVFISALIISKKCIIHENLLKISNDADLTAEEMRQTR